MVPLPAHGGFAYISAILHFEKFNDMMLQGGVEKYMRDVNKYADPLYYV